LDELLMSRYRDGDLRAFEELFTRHARAVNDFYFYMTDDREQAVLLSQEAWLAVRKHRSDFADGTRLLPWLFGQAVAVRRERSPAAGSRSRPPTSAPALREAPASERTLASLPESYREVLVLQRLSGLSFGDIAAALGATEAAVKARALQGYVLLAESRPRDSVNPPAADLCGPRSSAPTPSRCPETEKLISLMVASPQARAAEPLAALVRHLPDCPLCQLTHQNLIAGYRALEQLVVVAPPQSAALEQIARAVLATLAHDTPASGFGWSVAVVLLALLLLAVASVSLFLR
jgi:RNA polymerase sigma-70 factor (ECF subfamily)